MGGAVILMAVLTGIYGCVWNGYFNKLIEFPFWRRGNWLMIALYAGILFFFLYTYGGFRIGYLKKGNLLCSQILSIGLLNIITYIQISLLDKISRSADFAGDDAGTASDGNRLDIFISAAVPAAVSAEKNASGMRRSSGISSDGKN